MVPAASSIAKVADADRPGVRIAAVRNHASTNELVRQVKQAELVYAETPESTFDLIRNGQADVMASIRLVLLDFSTKLSGARVLDDRYEIPQRGSAVLSFVGSTDPVKFTQSPHESVCPFLLCRSRGRA